MITLLLALIAVMSLGILGGGVYAYVKADRVIQEFNETIYYCFQPSVEDGLSPVAKFIDQASELASQKIGVTVQAAIKGSIGGTMKGVNAELEEIAADGDPAAALAMTLPKSLKKNPIALLGLQMMLQKMKQGPGAGSPGNGKVSSQTRFNL